MAQQVELTTDAAEVLAEAEDHLAADPVRTNIVRWLLAQRRDHPDPGRYWLVRDGTEVVGVGFQSPIGFYVTVTPMRPEAGTVLARAVADAEADGPVPGVSGEVATATHVAGEWAVCTRRPAHPDQAARIYEIADVTPPPAPPGAARLAGADELDLLVTWAEGFSRDVGELGAFDPAAVERRLASGQLWVWDDGTEPVSFLGIGPAVGAVTRVGPVYTPPDRRGRGAAGALVASVSADALDQGHRCILYADLANPTSTSIYVRMGYRPVADTLRYRFAD